MKITRTQLKQIIKEEMGGVLNEASEQQKLGLTYKFTSKELIKIVEKQIESGEISIDNRQHAVQMVGQIENKIRKEGRAGNREMVQALSDLADKIDVNILGGSDRKSRASKRASKERARERAADEYAAQEREEARPWSTAREYGMAEGTKTARSIK